MSALAEPTLLYENENYRILNKPSGWHSVKGDSQDPDIETWLQNNFQIQKDLPESGLIHRLDHKTSGVLAAAKHIDAYKDLQHRFRKSLDIQKIYWALSIAQSSAGLPKSFELFFSSRYRGSKKVSVDTKGPKKHSGKCAIRSLQKFKNIELYEIELIGPGQRHQIRASMAYFGYPLIGDALYGGDSLGPTDLFGLHARSISIDKKLIEAPTPDAWAKILKV